MGFKISSEFPSRFLSGDEINGHVVPVVISSVKKEIVNEGTPKQEEVLVVYFEGKERGMRLNKTRANEIKDITGSDDTDMWKGKKAALYTRPQNAFGELHNVLHVKKDDARNPQTSSTNSEELPTIQVDEEEIDLNDIPV